MTMARTPSSGLIWQRRYGRVRNDYTRSGSYTWPAGACGVQDHDKMMNDQETPVHAGRLVDRQLRADSYGLSLVRLAASSVSAGWHSAHCVRPFNPRVVGSIPTGPTATAARPAPAPQ